LAAEPGPQPGYSLAASAALSRAFHRPFFVRQAAARTSGDYELVLALPDRLPTFFDPAPEGTALSRQRRRFPAGGFTDTLTYSSTWAAQGLGPADSVWYEHRFRLAEAARGRSIGLFLGGFDDEARVWLNGVDIGTSGRRFSRPGEFDLSNAIQPMGENRLVIEIVRNVPINELGVGGLFRPSFLYSGPVPPPGN